MWVLVAAAAWAGWVRTEILFGRDIPSGGTVTDADWDAFVTDEVLPRFPDGFTVLHGEGHWRGEAGPEDEDSLVLVVVHPRKRASDLAIEAVRAAYRGRFHQESVLRVDTRARVAF
jgi:hypothetical protein